MASPLVLFRPGHLKKAFSEATTASCIGLRQSIARASMQGRTYVFFEWDRLWANSVKSSLQDALFYLSIFTLLSNGGRMFTRGNGTTNSISVTIVARNACRSVQSARGLIAMGKHVRYWS
ncbi:hypothetical protein J6590_040739 [Homalodisca vitripennis]|nr:hypothetical protein J6590_040739 [Homalodisca vitripennis]